MSAPGGSSGDGGSLSRAEPYQWLAGAGLALAALMIVGLLTLIVAQGLGTFWPRRITEFTLRDGTKLLGEVTREEYYRPRAEELASVPAEIREKITSTGGASRRRLVRTGNFELTGEDFKWIDDYLIVREERPSDAWLLERQEWGPAIGYLRGLTRDGATLTGDTREIGDTLGGLLAEGRALNRRLRTIERSTLGGLNDLLERARLAARKASIDHGEGSPEHVKAQASAAAMEDRLTEAHRTAQPALDSLRAANSRYRLAIVETGGRIIPDQPSVPDEPMLLSRIVRAYPANQVSVFGRLSIYMDRWWEFLTAEPREANTEGGVFPALFGTFVMTVMMSAAVAPFGVIAALYLREYAKQGPLVSGVRIAVNNLAGVPSIVFGAFGLGFFCYGVGGWMDRIFNPERLPAPTFGTGGILWASLTLALLTVPVVIVATEEALAAVPRSLREGSLACGASRWQTIRRIVLPRATPGIMTGMILAMARGAGEVAPLMITGVVKLAPDLPVDGRFPYLHLERSFMHLGFHIYDVGFQSRNAEAARPMVFTTTLLLIALITFLNLAALGLRARLRRQHMPSHF